MNFDPTKTLDDIKRDVTVAAIEYHGKSKHKAAKQLKITVRTIDMWLTKWGLFEEYGRRHICNRMSHAEVEAVWTAANFNKERMAQLLQCSRITVYKLLVRYKFVVTRSKTYGI
jgi:DNA-binding NtrC family response regulator